MNGSTWRIVKKREKDYFAAIGKGFSIGLSFELCFYNDWLEFSKCSTLKSVSPLLITVLGALSSEITFTIDKNHLKIVTSAAMQKVEQNLIFGQNVTMKSGNNPIVPGPEIIQVKNWLWEVLVKSELKIERRRHHCDWKASFSHPEQVKNGKTLVEFCTWRLIKNDTLLEVRRKSSWDMDVVGKWIFEPL